MLNLNEREASLGTVNTRVEKHGDEDVPALDIPLSGIAISEKELNVLLCDPSAYKALFDKPAGTRRMTEPKFRVLGPLRFREKIEGADVSLWLGMAKTPVVFRGAKLSSVRVELPSGGTALLSLKVQCTPQMDKHIPRILELMGHQVQIAIKVDGYGQQKDLLDDDKKGRGKPEDEEGDDD